jgi:hypothetical protein
MAEPLAAGGEVACARPAFRAGRGATVLGSPVCVRGAIPTTGTRCPGDERAGAIPV